MSETFFDRFFQDFWSSLDRSLLYTSESSMLRDHHAFEWLIKTIRPETLLELGSWMGHSANLMIDICRREGITNARIVCVDTFLGAMEHWLNPAALKVMNRRNGMPTFLFAFLGNTIERGNENRVFPLTTDTYAASIILRESGFKADLIFIDAGHEYPQVVEEIRGYLPLLTDRGVLFGDDYDHKPVANAVHDMAKEFGYGVIVMSGKWIFLNDSLMRHIAHQSSMPPDTVIRHAP